MDIIFFKHVYSNDTGSVIMIICFVASSSVVESKFEMQQLQVKQLAIQ